MTLDGRSRKSVLPRKVGDQIRLPRQPFRARAGIYPYFSKWLL